MIMHPGTGDISNYSSYTSNCRAGQMPYKIPVNYLQDIQLYINIGNTKPDAIQYQLIHTCGGPVIENPMSDYVIGQDVNGNWYGVFKNFTGATPKCFVIAITLTFGANETIYFSEEYCIAPGCDVLTLLKGCYGNLDNKLSFDCNGVYFGTPYGSYLGDPTIVYKHELLIGSVEVSLSAIKNSFKQGRTRNFRTEKEKIYQFFADFIPEWYLSEIDAIFYRGEVFIGQAKYLVNETQFEKIEDCKRIWKPSVTLKESCYQSFSCEVDPCSPSITDCCDPSIITVVVSEVPFESGFITESGTGLGVGGSNIIIAQGVIDGAYTMTGTFDAITGLIDGSNVITCDAFTNCRVFVERGNIQVLGLDQGDGSGWYTKNFGDNFITFTNALTVGESFYIETIK